MTKLKNPVGSISFLVFGIFTCLHPSVTYSALTSMTCDLDSDWCSFTQDKLDFFDWKRGNGSSTYEPPTDRSGTGQALFIDPTSQAYSDYARLYSPDFQFSGCGSISFFYFASGANVGELNLKLKSHALLGLATLWSFNGSNPLPAWQQVSVAINFPATFKLVFEGTAGYGAITLAVDDITVTSSSSCPPHAITPTTDTGSLSCDFEADWCGFTTTNVNNFHWLRHSNATPTPATGPKIDHTFGTDAGYYLYAETDQGVYNDKTLLYSPPITLFTGCADLNFWYHIWGTSVEVLRVYIDGSPNAPMWQSASGFSVIQSWQAPSSAPFRITSSETFKLVFEVSRGIDNHGDYAIDDVTITELSSCTQSVAPTVEGNGQTTILGDKDGKTLRSASDTQHPSLYPNDFSHTWNISVSSGLKVKVKVTAMDLEECCDFLTIDGEVFTGYTIPPEIDTNSSRVSINFRSDRTVQRTGFILVWTMYGEPRVYNFGDGRSDFPGWVFGILAAFIFAVIVAFCVFKYLWKRYKKVRDARRKKRYHRAASPGKASNGSSNGASRRPITASGRPTTASGRPVTAATRRYGKDEEQYDAEFEQFKAETRRHMREQFDQHLYDTVDNSKRDNDKNDDHIANEDGGDSLSDGEGDSSAAIPGIVEKTPRPSSARPKSGAGGRPGSSAGGRPASGAARPGSMAAGGRSQSVASMDASRNSPSPRVTALHPSASVGGDMNSSRPTSGNRSPRPPIREEELVIPAPSGGRPSSSRSRSTTPDAKRPGVRFSDNTAVDSQQQQSSNDVIISRPTATPRQSEPDMTKEIDDILNDFQPQKRRTLPPVKALPPVKSLPPVTSSIAGAGLSPLTRPRLQPIRSPAVDSTLSSQRLPPSIVISPASLMVDNEFENSAQMKPRRLQPVVRVESTDL
ncbi:uncharacterized protein LOC106176676 [Lingula anatina]|uniref:Uncharacterized protein LOC106176676 n=1 Tax=Lingula anatina TaxID=7574 RepID=A0A1S3JWD4_LINAN|nr:uncharacterized protein LOC106176676 [Lingula anatina]|eukprot:XP_013414612.1 uncharacterized protein LOC106176676 [Lingula anatina]